MSALHNRHSVRKFDNRDLSAQDLSNLLYAAMGRNREDGRRTAPSCRNFKDIRLFVFDKSGVCEYIPDTHSLRRICDGDHRSILAAGQEFVNTAPVVLVMVSDLTKYGEINERARFYAAVDGGIVSENINVAASGLGLGTVTRGMMDADAVLKLLGLEDGHMVILNNPVGYPAK